MKSFIVFNLARSCKNIQLKYIGMFPTRYWFGEAYFEHDRSSSDNYQEMDHTLGQQKRSSEEVEDLNRFTDKLRPRWPVKDFIRPCIGDYKLLPVAQVPKMDFYKVASVTSPDEFVLQNAPFWTQTGWYQQLQQFYSDKNLCEKAKIETSHVFTEHLYAWKHAEFGWCRARVDDLDLFEDIATVRLIDEGIMVDVNTGDLRELSFQFFSYPPMGWRFRLHDVKPSQSSPTWSDLSLQVFREACQRGDNVTGLLPSGIVVTSPVNHRVPMILMKPDVDEVIAHTLTSRGLADKRVKYRWEEEFQELPL